MKALKKPLAALLLSTIPALAGCGGTDTVGKTFHVRFSPEVAGQPLRCDTSYPGIGQTKTTLQLLDFKMYVRDVTLVRANGERQALVLEQDGTWQRDGVALLDFEDGTGTCDTGSPETRLEVVGTAPDLPDYTGLEFKLGLPEELNHLDGATAAAPLNSPDMWWSWQGGYKFLRLDVRSSHNTAWYFHLGASGCKGSPGEGFTCAATNQSTVVLDGFHPERQQVALDLAGFYAGSDLDTAGNAKTDPIRGCMSGASDPECPALFGQVGLSMDGTAHERPASFIHVR